jgi:adenylate cyclase class IV
MSRNIEIELKYAAGHVGSALFNKTVKGLASYLGAVKRDFKRLENTLDTFYLMPNDVKIRHRRVTNDDPHGELTIKSRKSETSTLERMEVDLPLANNIYVADFMQAVGAKELFTITKSYDLYVMKYPEYSLDIVRYTARRANHNAEGKVVGPGSPTLTFIEVEVDKHSLVSTEESMEIVGRVGKELSKALDLGEPLNASLFECFNKSKYPKEAVIQSV